MTSIWPGVTKSLTEVPAVKLVLSLLLLLALVLVLLRQFVSFSFFSFDVQLLLLEVY